MSSRKSDRAARRDGERPERRSWANEHRSSVLALSDLHGHPVYLDAAAIVAVIDLADDKNIAMSMGPCTHLILAGLPQGLVVRQGAAEVLARWHQAKQ